MKRKIAILGSTGSIGKSTLDIIRKDKKNFEVVLLTAKNKYNNLIQQAIEFNVKNILIYNDEHYNYLKRKLKYKKINIFSKKSKLREILNIKVDYTMCAISGLDGLKPTLEAIEISKIEICSDSARKSIISPFGLRNSFWPIALTSPLSDFGLSNPSRPAVSLHTKQDLWSGIQGSVFHTSEFSRTPGIPDKM